MTRGAGLGEVALAFFGVAGAQIFGIDSAAAADTRFSLRLRAVNEGNERRDFVVAERKTRHAFFGTSVADDGRDLIAAYIVSHEFRARKIGSGFAASGIAAVTKSAMLNKQVLAVFDLLRRVRLRRSVRILAHGARRLQGGLLVLRTLRRRRILRGCRQSRETSRNQSRARNAPQPCTFRINCGILAARSSGVARTKSAVDRAGGFFALGSVLVSLIFSSIARF